MDRKFDTNPNTKKGWEIQYKKKVEERDSPWLMEHLLPHVPETGSLLEVGCGMGKVIRDITWSKPKLWCVGIDFSETAIEKAKELGGGKFIEMDAEGMQYNEEFDFVMCVQSLEHFDHPVTAIQNMVKALKPGGKLFITVPWPRSSLDNGVRWHHWRFWPKDFERELPGCKVKKVGINHQIVIWTK